MPRGENRPSILLNRDENEQVFALIGSKCLSLATAVVQLFTTEGPGHSEWKKKDTGVLCLIKDSAKRSYFFRIYCLCRKAMIWEHEVYLEIEYKSPRTYLHTFEAEEYMTAFNFANEDEARSLRNILIEKIELRKQRREDRRQRSMLAAQANDSRSQAPPLPRQNGVAPPPAAPPPPAPVPVQQPLKTSNSISGNYVSKGKKPKTRKLTKADIGSPQNFKHVSHVGLDPNKCFDVEIPEEDMRSFFSMAGVSETQLQDHATRSFIYDFIQSHGGVNAVKEELTDKPAHGAAPSPPAAPAPPVPARSPAPPAPPSRAPPPPPARAVPPAPPGPPAAPPAPPAPPAPRRDPPPPRPAHPPSSAPPPVPPPPPPALPPPPPPPAAPPAPPAPPAAPDPRSMLMESIRSGNKNLKHVEIGSRTSLNEDNRTNLLSEIRQGIELRSVGPPPEASGAGAGGGALGGRTSPGGLAGALARALQERSRVIHSSDSDLSDNTSDGEWDD